MPEEKNFMIKNLIPGLVERGKIKIGIKGEWRDKKAGGKFQLPQKLDHFVVTGALRDENNNFVKDSKIHEMLGQEPIEVPIFLLYNDIEMNFQTRYACYTGARLFCSGNGEKAHYIQKDGSRAECACPCKRQEPTYQGSDKCKINGTLSVVIEKTDIIGGVWKFRTTSYNSVVQILGSLTMIKRISGGFLAGLPLWLTLRPKTVTSPVDGRVQTVYVVGIEFRGSMDALQAAGYKRALTDAKHELKIANIEEEAKRLISPAAADVVETAAEIQDEFYPEASKAAGPRNAGSGGAPELKKPEKPGESAGPGAGPQDQPPESQDQPPESQDQPPESQDQGSGGPGPEKPAPLAKPAQARRGRPSRKKQAQPPADGSGGAPGPQDQGSGAPAGPAAESSAPAEREPAPPAGPENQGENKGQVSLF